MASRVEENVLGFQVTMNHTLVKEEEEEEEEEQEEKQEEEEEEG